MAQAARQLGLALGAMVLSLAFVLGSIMLSLVEGGSRLALVTQPGAEENLTPLASLTPNPLVILGPGEPTYTPQPSPTNTLVSTPTPGCTAPEGWVQISVEVGYNLETLAGEHGISVEDIMRANCLDSSQVIPGMLLYIPPSSPTETPLAPAATATAKCGPPKNWVEIIIKPGDTLYELSRIYGVGVPELQEANCLGNSIDIRAGQKLYVPNVLRATSTPTQTRTPTPQFTLTPTTVPSATSTPTVTLTPSFTPTVTLTPTETLTPTITPTPTETPTPTNTPTPTETPTPTDIVITLAPNP